MDFGRPSEGTISTVSRYEDATSELSMNWSYNSFVSGEEPYGDVSITASLEEEMRKYEQAVRKIEERYANLGQSRKSQNPAAALHKHPLSKNLFNKITKRINSRIIETEYSN